MSGESLEIISYGVDETIALGQAVGKQLQGGEVIAMEGTLGTGKTHFIKGLALGLDVADVDVVTSPTFTLINEYEGRLPLYHADAYRLEKADQLAALGFDEMCSGLGVVVVEWADRVRLLMDDYKPINIYLEHRGESERALRIENLPSYVTI
ncbi:MAG: tRNA (adenosine(37)-N6)-threonylcarbamoyltransferase complex ATPase subunit type 1 TsaE [Sedimentisphaerales bacterium]|nr:tRNA (adenosine(37)-N6)-threonylcarbamoyltransferase complex ATPase subunit type 1 TsaE [Sedimentisphaerales bacterium]